MSANAFRPTYAEINLRNLADNLASLKSYVGEDLQYLAVVKADAYGHGAVECARILSEEGADWFGVAIPEEGLELRVSGIEERILSLGGFWKGQEDLILQHDITPVLFDVDSAANLDRAAASKGLKAKVHIKVDTGMGRVGVPFEGLSDFAEAFRGFQNLELEGLMTHFASAEDLTQKEFTETQIERFNDSVALFAEKGMRPWISDLANSPGAVAHPKSRGNLVRPGGVLYGLCDDVLPQTIPLPELKPVMSLYSAIALIKPVKKGSSLGYGRTFVTRRDSVIGTIPIGYQDGYMRGFSNKAEVIVNGRRAPVVGRVSMDWTIVDLTDVPDAKKGTPVTLMGSDGSEEVTASELGSLADTISYEITCGVSRRVRRVFVDSAE